MSFLSSDPMLNASSPALEEKSLQLSNTSPGHHDRILVLGANGFLGSAVTRRLERSTRWTVVPSYRFLPATRVPSRPLQVIADVTKPQSLRSAVDGVRCVVHAANYIGRDEEAMEAVNVRGTASVVDAAKQVGAKVFYISTTSVYGLGPFRGQDESELVVAPISKLSQSRARAEEYVLSSGGTVLRPHLTYGPGDRWFIPALVRLTKSLGGTVDAGRGVTSLIHVDDLAAIVEGVLASTHHFTGTALHASHPRATTFAAVLEVLRRDVGLSVPTNAVPFDHVLSQAHQTGLSEHQVRLLSTDNWFSSEALWARLSTPPRIPFVIDRQTANFYRELLDGQP